MSACSKYLHRLQKAMDYNEIALPKGFIDKIAKRATTDAQIDKIAHALLDVLEPPHCQKSHCPHFTTYGFAGCSKGLVPGKCSLNRDYVKRREANKEKIKQQLIERIAKDKKVTVEHVAENFDFERYLSNCGGISRVMKYYEANKLNKR